MLAIDWACLGILMAMEGVDLEHVGLGHDQVDIVLARESSTQAQLHPRGRDHLIEEIVAHPGMRPGKLYKIFALMFAAAPILCFFFVSIFISFISLLDF
jgi:hypothetical protein